MAPSTPGHTQRVYRACIYCRQRKSKCDFESDGPTWPDGQTQCLRCKRERRQCIIAPTHPARQRARALKTRNGCSSDTQSGLSSSWNGIADEEHDQRELSAGAPQQRQTFMPSTRPTNPMQASANQSPQVQDPNDNRGGNSEQSITESRLQNPGDALQLLARIAHGSEQETLNNSIRTESRQTAYITSRSKSLLQEIEVSVSVVSDLLVRYRSNYHAFFPIANDSVLDPNQIERSAQQEPLLLLVILTISSKQEPAYANVHQTCSQCLQTHVAKILSFPPTDVEAVEALLLVAEWTLQRFENETNVGSGEEDRAAWMHVGLAVRLAYLQGLDSTSFVVPSTSETQSNKRKRLAWAELDDHSMKSKLPDNNIACFMSDRQISVRVGRAFWSRGPGPMSTISFEDYLPFRRGVDDMDDFASIFQANIELTQLLSNAHDILYASEPHRDRLFRSGEYAKYIDDFRNALANWYDRWGSMSCSPNIKSSLMVSHEYLRLYITAFALQATLSRERLIARQEDYGRDRGRPLANRLAGGTDARFIYEAISAAKNLLSTFNSFIDPRTCLQFMPLKYYLYVIYAAVFLYKARAIGILDSDGLERMVHSTIKRLQSSSNSPKDVGSRYCNLLALLWRKPFRNATEHIESKPNSNLNANEGASRQKEQTSSGINDANRSNPARDGHSAVEVGQNGQGRDVLGIVSGDFGQPLNSESPQFCFAGVDPLSSPDGFSWRDLEAVGHFATKANTISGSAAAASLPMNFEDFMSPSPEQSNEMSSLWQGDAIWSRRQF